MSIENQSQGTPEEIEEAKKHLTQKQEVLSGRREELFNKLSEEEKELENKCRLFLAFQTGPGDVIEGTIDGIEVCLSDGGYENYKNTINKKSCSNAQANEIFHKYKNIAEFQTRGFGTELNEKEVEEMEKTEINKLVEKLLSI